MVTLKNKLGRKGANNLRDSLHSLLMNGQVTVEYKK